MKNTLCLLLCFWAPSFIFSQSNINQSLSVNSTGAAADASAQLDVSATDKGMLVPRMTSAQRTAIASPATGLLVFDTTTGGFWFYNATAWQNLSAPSTLQDADGNTKVQVEKNPDEDIIRFDLAGTENLVLRKNAGGSPRLELHNPLSNTFVGMNAGNATSTGSANTAMGTDALAVNSTGESNIAVGRSSLLANIAGSNNVAIGDRTLFANSTGSTNVAMGATTMLANTTGSHNTAIGTAALPKNTTGYSNTAIGRRALFNSTFNSNLVAVGDSTLFSSVSGAENVALGSKALFANTSGSNNTATGYQALFANTTGSNNTALGNKADVLSGTLTNATAIGYNAKVGASNSLVLGGTGPDKVNVGIGTTTPGALLHANGIGYGLSHTAGGVEMSTFIDPNYAPAGGWFGTDSNHPLFFYTNSSLTPQMALIQSGSVGIGATASNPHASALLDLSATDRGMLVPRMTTTQRTAIASPATGLLVYDTDTNAFWFYNGTAWTTIGGGGVSTLIADADNDTKIQVEESPDEDIIRFDLAGTEHLVLRKNAGGHARLELPNASESTFVGQDAGANMTTGTWNTAVGFNALAATTGGSFNTAVGWKALTSNTSGFMNSAFGIEALYSNTSGTWNTATGRLSLYGNTNGTSNTANGDEALLSNTGGSFNTAVGRRSLKSNTVGNENTAIGYNSLTTNTSGLRNTAVGSSALRHNTIGEANTALGQGALESNSSGNDNVSVGWQALFFNTTGSNNTALGYLALDNNNTGSNNTAIGKGANVSTGALTNATVIGSGASVNATNNVRIGNAAVTVIEGQVDWTFPSDARFKFNIHDDAVPGLSFIEKLRPVTYQFDTRKFDEHLMQNMPDSIQRQRLAGQDYSKSTALVQTGFLAQEVEQACKDLNFQFSGLHTPESEVDNYGLAYGSFVPLLVKAVQEQQQMIEHGKRRLENLEAENAALKLQVASQNAVLEKITAALTDLGVELR